MRWDNLFDDLESQLESELTAEEVDLQAEEERLRLARLSLRERIVALHGSGSRTAGSPLRVILSGGTTISVRPVAIGRDWLSADLLDESQRHPQCVLPFSAIAGMVLTRDQVSSSLVSSRLSEEGISSRLGLGFVLRDLCRRRRSVELQLLNSVVHGTIDRVGRDHVDLATHEPGSVRRDSAVFDYRVIPLAQLQLVRL